MGSFGALCKISYVKIFIRLLPPQFSPNFNQNLLKNSNLGEYKAILFLGVLPNLSNSQHFADKSPNLHCISHKTILESSGERVHRVLKPWGLLFEF